MFRIFLCGLFSIFTSVIYTQNSLVVNKLTIPLTFDGIPDETAWQSISPLPMVMHMPVFGKEPSETTITRIAFDDEYFYVSGLINYKDPANIRANSKKRDYANSSCDWFGVIIDSFNDRKNALGFLTNPNGLRTDATVQNDFADTESDVNFSWNTFWDVKTLINDHGWSAEIRIPFSSLRFQVEDNKTIMGITILRYSPALSEMATFPAISPDFPAAYWKPSLTSLVEFTGLKPEKPVYVAPYLTAGIGQVNELNEEGTDYKMNSTLKYDAGADLKYSITNNLTVDLTVNTDFAQVEADNQKINLTRYSLFFPEKRIFFLEKADVFDFPLLGGNNMFYSRRIGLYNGNPVRILGGVRMTGRINKWDIGILDMQTAEYKENPAENFGVFRTKRSVFNQNSYLGGILTSRLGLDGSYNMGYGLDGVVRVTGDEYLTVRWAQTFENDSVKKVFDMSPSRLLVNWEHRNQTGFGYDFVYTWSGDRFNPGIGFEVKDNYQGVRGILRQGWLPAGETFLRYHRISLTAYDFWNTATNLHETTSGELAWYFEAKRGFSGFISTTIDSEDLAETLYLGSNQASVPSGRYSFAYLTAQYNTSKSHALSTNLTGEAGKFYDGWKLSLIASPMLNIGSGINLTFSYNFDYVNFDSRSIQFTNHILGLKGLMTLTIKTSLSAFIQYNTAVDRINSNIRFRYNPREGNDFWLVYDEGLNTDLRREIPFLPHSSGRTILLKYTYTFRL
jgi:opacity protein-like surface antigen